MASGPAVVLPAWWVSNVVEDWHFGPMRRFVEGLAAGRTVVRYDRLGTGLSDRDRPPETFTQDFEDATLCAVLDELGLARVALRLALSAIFVGPDRLPAAAFTDQLHEAALA